MVPTMVQVNMNGTYYIQPLNHDQTIKRAKIQFTGLGDIFVFLQSADEQHGSVWHQSDSPEQCLISN